MNGAEQRTLLDSCLEGVAVSRIDRCPRTPLRDRKSVLIRWTMTND